jgi:sulfur carrier protein
MKIIVNGKEQVLESPLKLSEFVQINLNGKEPRGIAVALNDYIIPKQKWDSVSINENDEIEIVHAVQGG